MNLACNLSDSMTHITNMLSYCIKGKRLPYMYQMFSVTKLVCKYIILFKKESNLPLFMQ